MIRFELTASARRDLKEIATHTQMRRGRAQRNAYLQVMDRVFHMLAETPAIGRGCDAVRAGYRKFPHGAHMVFYNMQDDGILLIVRILHAAMDVESNLGV